MRSVALVAHRYVGLALALFVLVAGLTGSVLAFKPELEAAISPGLFRATPPAPGARHLGPLELREALAAQLPAGARVTYIPLVYEPGTSALFFVEGRSGSTQDVDDEFFVHPYTGEVLGSRKWGSIEQGLKNVVPFIYRLHFSLALGTVGTYLFGIVALLWTFDCFVGLYLTFPPAAATPCEGRLENPLRAPRSRVSSWLARWKRSWLLKTKKPLPLLFTWHRASGLWVWGMLLVFAWSAVGMNLTEVYNPIMGAAFGMEERAFERLPKLATPRTEPQLSWPKALDQGRALMKQQASRRDVAVFEERTLGYFADRGMFQYRVRSSLDISERYPSTVIWFDGDTGELATFVAPTGQRTGNTITSWLNHLHFGSITIGGWTYRVFVSSLGLLVAALSVTGVWVWWHKRRKHGAVGRAERHTRPDCDNQRGGGRRRARGAVPLAGRGRGPARLRGRHGGLQERKRRPERHHHRHGSRRRAPGRFLGGT